MLVNLETLWQSQKTWQIHKRERERERERLRVEEVGELQREKGSHGRRERENRNQGEVWAKDREMVEK